VLDNQNADGCVESGDDPHTSVYKFGGLLSSTSGVNVAELCTADIDQHSG